MAKRVEVTLVDDTDGSAAEETVRFALDGVSYEIDLSSKNAEKLRTSLASWIGFATRSGGRRALPRKGKAAATPRDLGSVREWARANGYQVSDRGRISAEVQTAYDVANP